MRGLIVAGLVTTAAALGCEDEAGRAAGTLPEFITSQVAEGCAYQSRCGSIGESERMSCLVSQNPSLGMPVDWNALLAANRLSYDSARGTACLDALAKADCADVVTVLLGPACRDVIKGQVPAGAACTADVECAGGICAGSKQDGCAGTCAKYAALGESCGSAGCDTKTSRCDSVTMKCVALGAVGETCLGSYQCQPSLNCIPDAMEKPRCTAPYAAGAACPVGYGCTMGLFCDKVSHTCKPRIASGGACAGNDQCAGGLPCIGYDGSSMSAAGVCGAWKDAGAPCTPLKGEGGVTGCPQSMICDPTSKTCLVQGTVGSDCTMGPCHNNTYCDSITKKCTTRVPYKGACTPPPMNGREPCVYGSCSPTTKTCELVCT